MTQSLARVLRSFLAAAAAVLAFLAVSHPATALAAGTVSIGRPFADPAPNQTFQAGQPIRFSCSGKFKPNKGEDEEPWVAFLWNWGDGTSTDNSGPIFGGGAQSNEVMHTFAAGGDYTVTCTAYHGFTLFGYKFAKTAKLKVRVLCPGAVPGPKKCKKGVYETFSGIWVPTADTVERNPELRNLQLSIGDLTGKPQGVVTYTGNRAKNVILPFKMKPLDYVDDGSREFPDEYVQFLSKAKHDVEGGGVVLVEFHAAVSYNDTDAYRRLKLGLVHLPAYLDEPGPWDERVILEFTLQSRPDAATAAVCSTVAPGKDRTSAGEQLAVAVQVANEGPAGVRSNRLLLAVEVTGGTVVQAVADQRMVDVTTGTTSAIFTVGALGEGKGLVTSSARGMLAVLPDNGSAGIRIQVSVLDVGAPQDQLFSVTTPPDRVLCIPVTANNPTGK